MSADTISQSEAARRAGVSRSAIQKHLASGRIISEGNRVNLASFNEWLDLKKETHSGVQPPLPPEVQPPPEVAPQVVSLDRSSSPDLEPPAGSLLDMKSALLLEQNAKARIKQLDFDERSGSVVEIAVVTARVGKEYAAVRRKLLALPAEHAPSVHRCKTVADVQERLRVLITRALEELTADGGSTIPTGV
ncbi:hypothetical protein GOB83_11555 [Acetobacter fabarum]|uniref:hypothetical protein n=1 Tax=Acetobacter fabarum TaxID=483199 RepID=UPI0014050452|nr:hypothetical protein [Acetobacter fabarum]NHO42807.1 hypothetical protein [Acetobacter fabarum]GBQ33784.1 hypothetical protein AA19596_1306 [Acetobacter fabarum DSM 19596]